VAVDTSNIIVIPIYEIYIPNAFTPNGDGNNDFFEVFGNKAIWKQFEVQVFDRIGEKVFQSNDMNFKWDGTYKNVLMNPAVFVYQIHLTYINNHTEKLYKGSVTLVR
jgi:gliding motility-associated-like protein